MKKLICLTLAVLLMAALFTGCSQTPAQGGDQELKKISVLLDWTPNTNHTGLFAAKELGYFAEEGLDADIFQPSESTGVALVAAGQGDFAVSYQEEVTYARTAADPLPIKAIAAVIQHNTSGFASPVDRNITSPKDFEGKKYGGWGSPMEETVIRGLMEKAGADYSKLEIVDVGDMDFFAATEKAVDFTWIYEGWDGVAAGLRGVDINFIKVNDVEPILDYYTPVLVANDDMLKNDPETVKKFLRAVTKGYQYCVDHPEEAAQYLLNAAPETDKELAVASQKYLAKEYISDAPRFGEMSEQRWTDYANWMYENKLIEQKLDVSSAFTNEFLPE